MLLVDQVNGTKVYAKSGWGMDVEPQVGWWTGWVEQPNGKVTAFSLNMEMNKTEHVEARKTIVYEALQQLGLIQHQINIHIKKDPTVLFGWVEKDVQLGGENILEG